MPSYTPVYGAPGQWTKDALIEHVKTGMQVELGTLPIYFCALYSIKRDNGQWGSKARANILAVAEQEMLHLALAGNMLRALGGTQLLYNKSFMPEYPSQILFDKIDMELRPADKKNLECFLKIEAPYLPPPELEGKPMFYAEILPSYQSIGEFYKELQHGILEVSKNDPHLFSSNNDKQFTGEEFFDERMTVVVDTKTALQALETIVDQGEGSIGVPDSHYSIFVELYQRRKEWVCIDYVDKPHTADYAGKSEVAYRMSLAVDASFCFLLQTIDRCWAEGSAVKRTQLFRNIHRLMVEILSPVAHVLVEQIIEGEKHAAPCFEFYPPDSQGKALSPKELYDRLTAEVDRAYQAAGGETKEAIGKIAFSLKALAPAA
ncbi:ferritin-like-domain-containing protein [Ganoderma leucocontextum]|nr:ferritin-like-domain-containing protein [Ganoderma leucocontextum]